MANTPQDRKTQSGDGRPRRPNLSNVNLKREGLDERRAREAAESRIKEKESVSAGAIDRVIDLAFNPTRDKLREVTIIDRMQGRTFPVIDTMNSLFLECIKVAVYRQSPELYEEVFEEEHPILVFDVLGEFLHRTAQWQKSVAGKNLERATDIALAETEKETAEDQQYGPGGRGYED
jgi:hypothetical protein